MRVAMRVAMRVHSNKSVDEGVRYDKDFFCGGFKEILEKEKETE